MAREILGNFTPLIEPEFGNLVDRLVRKHQRDKTGPRLKRLVREVVAAWERDQAITGGPAIGIRPMTDALARMRGY